MMDLIKFNPLFFSFVLPQLTDGALTLFGQDKEYWQNHKKVNEASPAYLILQTSPYLFILGALIWFVLTYILVKTLIFPLNFFVSLIFLVGHSWGSGSWLMRIFKKTHFLTPESRFSISLSYFILILYFVINSIISGLSFIYFFKYS